MKEPLALDFPGGSDGRELPAMQETQVQSLGWGDSPGERNGYPLQYSCLENSTERGASVQFSSVAQSCLTLCDPMDCSTPGPPVHCQLPELIQTHVH